MSVTILNQHKTLLQTENTAKKCFYFDIVVSSSFLAGKKIKILTSDFNFQTKKTVIYRISCTIPIS